MVAIWDWLQHLNWQNLAAIMAVITGLIAGFRWARKRARHHLGRLKSYVEELSTMNAAEVVDPVVGKLQELHRRQETLNRECHADRMRIWQKLNGAR